MSPNTKETQKETRILLVILPLIVLTCLSVWRLKVIPAMTDVASKAGIWDVRDFDFTSAGATMIGDVEYIPGELLTPEEFAASEHRVVGAVPDGTACLTSRVRILAPPGNHAFSRFTPDYAARVYVNGELLGTAGQPSASKDTAVFGERLLYFTAQPVDGVIEIVAQASNYAHRDSSSHVGWHMYPENTASRWVAGYTASAVFVMGFLILLFIVHMLLFLSLPSYRANLWIALLCLLWALRVGCAGPKILLALAPWLSWAAAFRVEYLAIPAAMLLLTLAYHRLFPGVLQKGFRIAVYCVTGVFGALYLFADTLFMSRTILVMESLAILATVYVLTRLLMKLRKPNAEQRVIIYGQCVVLAGLVFDSLFYNLNTVTNRILPGPVAEYAFVAFSMFQMTALFLGTMREVAAAKEKELRLMAENADLETRNLALSEQHKRTQELLRRVESLPEQFLVRGSLVLDIVSNQACINGEDMQLTQKEFALLHTLVRNEGKILSKESIYEAVWNLPVGGDARTVKAHLSHIRGKLTGCGYAITVSRGLGYCFQKSDE